MNGSIPVHQRAGRPAIARGAFAELPSMDEALRIYESQLGATVVEDPAL
jgi:hypothetical protein